MPKKEKLQDELCEECQKGFKKGDIKIDTPKHGKLCKECWSEKAGALVDKHPIFDFEDVKSEQS